jgi:PAS domain S-box-containing protein
LSINAAPLLDENSLFNGMVATIEDITDRKAAEEELHRSEAKYRSLTENSPDLIARFDRQFRHLFVNSIAANAGRYSKEEYIGKTIAEVGNSKQVANKWEERIRTVFETGQIVTVEDVFETSGGPRFFSTKFVPEFGPDGSVFSVQSIASDITDRKQAELNYQMLFQSMLDGFALHEIILNKQGKPVDYRFLSVNPAFERITGLKEAEIKGRTVLEVLPRTEKTWIENYGKVALTGEPMFFDNYARELGKHFEVSVFCPAPLQFVTVFVDITERKKAEEKIQQLNQELEQRVKDRTTKLEAANQELDAFAYSVSHDLRAPLRSMEGFSEALKTGYPEKLDEQGQHYLTRIQEASLEMGQLIEALLSLSRVNRDELKSEQIDLSQTTREIADEMKKQNPNRKVEIEISTNMVAKGDAHLLKIAVENLVNNAFKFTNIRDQAHIAIGMKKEADEKIYFVRDDGVGFDMAYASKLFVPFQRLHEKEKFPGSGIGLATVKRIITRHGGRIWAEAGVDQGATFYFTLGGK